jgi:hypothetical protein
MINKNFSFYLKKFDIIYKNPTLFYNNDEGSKTIFGSILSIIIIISFLICTINFMIKFT